MSTETYRKWWILSKKQLECLQEYDDFMKKNTKKEKSRVKANHIVSGLYTKYCMLVKNIDICLDQTIQPQKRVTIRKLVDSATTRLIEINNLLRDIDISEIHYCDGNLIEQKLIPNSIEFLNPTLFFPRPIEIEDMWQRIQKGERIFIPSPTLSPSASKTAEETEGEKTEGEKKEGEKPEGEKKEGEKKEGEAADEKKVEAQDDSKSKEAAKEEKKKRKASAKKLVTEKKELSLEEIEAAKQQEILLNAILLIQTSERGRQARLYCTDILGARGPDPNDPSRAKKPEVEVTAEDLDNAAIGFQKLYRGYMARKEQKQRELKRRYLIGMYEPSWKSTEEFDKLKINAEIRRQIVSQKFKEYVDSMDKEKERIMRVVAPGLMEDISDEIREWFHEWYTEIQCFDKIPPTAKGGTVLVVRCETFTPKEYLADLERKKAEKEKGKDDKAAKEKAAKEKKKKKEEEKKKKEAEKKKKADAKKAKEAGEWEFEFPKDEDEPPAMKLLIDSIQEYITLWREKKMIDNPLDEIYMDLILDQVCYEMQLEVRQNVDQLMKLELRMLNEALVADLKKAGKKNAKMPKEKKEKVKKPKVDKKDLTRNRRTEDIFQELIDNEIIRKYPKVHLDEFLGDFSYSNWDKREEECDTFPCLGDIRHQVAINCILPLGVGTMIKPKSVLIAGPKQSGKHLLANAIFTETKAVLFDLTPANLVGKYDGPVGQKMLLHLINKMSRLLQPSIIYFDGGEKPFYKKVPKEENDQNPKRFGSSLLKNIIKPIMPKDRVLVLAITNQPWAAKPSGLKKAFERVILVPRTDYGSAYIFWKHYLMRHHGVHRTFDLSCLAKLSVNYPASVIKEVVDTVMTPRRIIALSYLPLQEIELYDVLIQNPNGPINDKDYAKLMKWYNKVPIRVARANYQIDIDDAKAALAEQAEKAAQKKK
ncbi:IQ and AAA domain-containing protein 1-like isoform X1 [Onthophagus taurus]|uniref:IQ and AAA domain-containing protein 1-like isoform X1 n=2 Tax=Onthophagus taurus TaxID=166361 RepID=UPI0039BDF593